MDEVVVLAMVVVVVVALVVVVVVAMAVEVGEAKAGLVKVQVTGEAMLTRLDLDETLSQDEVAQSDCSYKIPSQSKT
jgi:hypothetical protein